MDTDKEAKYDKALSLVLKQAKDEALWLPTRSIEVAYLQQELRQLHAAIEGVTAL